MAKTIRAVILAVFIVTNCIADDKQEIIAKINKQALVAHKSATSPKLDGVLDDECWKPNACQKEFTVFGGTSTSQYPTTVKVAYDNDNLYFGFRCNEKAKFLKQNYRKDDEALWFDSSVEIFLVPQRSTVLKRLDAKERHFHFIFNPAGTRFDQLGMRGGGSWNGKWEVKTKIHPDYWVAEIKIPFTLLKARKQAKVNAPLNMDIWDIQIGKKSFGADNNELSSLFPASGVFRDHSNFGKMLLLEKSKGSSLGYWHDDTDYVKPQLKKINQALKSMSPQITSEIIRQKKAFIYRWRRSDGITYLLRREKLLNQINQLQAQLSKLQKQLLINKLTKNKQKTLLVATPAISDSKKIFPDFLPNYADSMKAVKISLCRGEFEPASVVLWAPEQLKDVSVSIKPVDGLSITAQWVKCWYQSGTAIRRGKRTLTPELLVNNDDIVKVDMIRKQNIFKEASSMPGKWVYPEDSEKLQPLKLLPAQFSKQIWLTAHASDNAVPGVYQSKIIVSSAGVTIAELPLKIEVLNFKLLPSKLTHGCYVNTLWGGKSDKKVKNEMRDLVQHGISTICLREKPADLPGIIEMMRKAGLNSDPVYLMNCVSPMVVPDANVKPEVIKGRLDVWLNAARKAKIKDLYIYMIDEAKGESLMKTKSIADIIHKGGAKTWCAFNIGASYRKYVGDSVDAVVYAGRPTRNAAAAAHRDGNTIFSYDNPQLGLELPETYRRNFGLLLWQMNFNGSFNFAWNWIFPTRGKASHPWDDFDSPVYRDHCMVYSTQTSVVKTIQSEGWREGVDDCRYLTTLEYWIKKAKDSGKNQVAKAASTWLSKIKDGDSATLKDLDDIRSKMIRHIQVCRKSLQK